MKTFIHIISLLLAAAFLLLFACTGEEDKETEQELAQNLLKSKSWQISNVSVPPTAATQSADWTNFTVIFNDTNLTTGGHPEGTGNVWPSGTYTLSEDGKTIIRSDGVVVNITGLTKTALNVYFHVDGIELTNGKIADLSGDYVFNLK